MRVLAGDYEIVVPEGGVDYPLSIAVINEKEETRGIEETTYPVMFKVILALIEELHVLQGEFNDYKGGINRKGGAK